MNTRQLKTLIKSVVKEAYEDESGQFTIVTEELLDAIDSAVEHVADAESPFIKKLSLEIADKAIDIIEDSLDTSLVSKDPLVDEDFSADWSGVEDVLTNAIKEYIVPRIMTHLVRTIPISKL